MRKYGWFRHLVGEIEGKNDMWKFGIKLVKEKKYNSKKIIE